MPGKSKLILILLINTLFMGSIYCQPTLTSIEKNISTGNHHQAYDQLKKINPSDLNKHQRAFYHYLMAKALEKSNNEDKAYRQYLTAKKQYISLDSADRAMEINLDIAYLLSAQENNVSKYEKYVEEYMDYAIKSNDKRKLASGYFMKGILELDKKQYAKSKEQFKTTLKLSQETGDEALAASVKNNLGSLYNEYFNKPDSALLYFKSNFKYINANGSIEELCHNYINQAVAYYYLGEHEKSIQYLKLAEALPLKNYAVKSKQYIYDVLRENYASLNDFESAYKYSALAKKFADSANVKDQNIAISNFEIKYQTKEKEVENLQLKDRVKTRNNWLYLLAGLLIVSAVIGWLMVKNSRRKQKILEQEKLIEQQKLEKALKDYELNSIDMMLEGQEKERQRIANDLHDNLGSMLATLKLNFENLKLRKNELREEETKLYERTDELIEEAYQKVRRLAHAKNVGVLANEGLIPALQKLAEKISIPGKLNIEIVPFGFNERIENTLEISIFRMIQELATNIIKHSKATEATIHLTRHEDNINIIVEDNGIGLEEKDIIAADGMGITSIKRKCEQLGGAMTIDSTPGKGTTIIIDIPV